MPLRSLLAGFVFAVSLSTAGAQPFAGVPASELATLAAQARRRFPQPVRVGDLIGRDVLGPTEAEHVLGHVAALARIDGQLAVFLTVGGVFGIGARRIAVPADAIVLLGQYVALVGIPPARLAALPAAAPPAAPLGRDESVRLGLTRPFH